MDNKLASLAFGALGHPSRVGVLRLLVRAGCGGLNVGELRERLGMPASTFAHHLRALADAGIVTQSKRGRQVISTANYDTIRALNAFLMEDCCREAFVSEDVLSTELET